MNNNIGEISKMKQPKKVVNSIPHSNKKIITYNWLKEQNVCEDAIDAFVNKFGKEAEWDEVMEVFDNRPDYKEYNFDKTKILYDSSWKGWLKEREYGFKGIF